MQTFLSESTMLASVQVLDNTRLNKQFLEGWQILDAISKTPQGGGQRVNGKVPFASNHPATNMWRGHEVALYTYLTHVRQEMMSRGTKVDVVDDKIKRTMNLHFGYVSTGLPAWYKDPVQRDKILLTHRGNLYNKYPERYPDYKVDSLILDKYLGDFVCCPGKHKPYYYPTHISKEGSYNA